MVLYLFGILFVKVLGDEHEGPDGSPEIREWFGSLPGAMFTLFTIVTLEGWPDIGREVWQSDQSYMVLVILVFIMITNLAIMNTVTAVIVEHTLTEALDQNEDILRRARHEMTQNAGQLVKIFCSADDNKNGVLSKTEFIEALMHSETRKKLQEMGLGEDFSCLSSDEIRLLFETMDIDTSGELTPQEFVKGMMQMRGNARARSLFELDCRVQKMHHMNRLHYDRVLGDLNNNVSRLQTKVDQESDTLGDMQKRQTRIERQLEAISAHLGVAKVPNPGCADTSVSQNLRKAPVEQEV